MSSGKLLPAQWPTRSPVLKSFTLKVAINQTIQIPLGICTSDASFSFNPYFDPIVLEILFPF